MCNWLGFNFKVGMNLLDYKTTVEDIIVLIRFDSFAVGYLCSANY